MAQPALKVVDMPPAEKDKDKSKAIDAALAQIERAFGKGSIMRLGEDVRPPIEVIPTGAIALGARRRLEGHARVGERLLRAHDVDAVFLDINMPGLSGLELAGVLGRYAAPPAIVFVTAHDDRAVHAFEIGATDYLLKPLREARLAEAAREGGLEF